MCGCLWERLPGRFKPELSDLKVKLVRPNPSCVNGNMLHTHGSNDGVNGFLPCAPVYVDSLLKALKEAFDNE